MGESAHSTPIDSINVLWKGCKLHVRRKYKHLAAIERPELLDYVAENRPLPRPEFDPGVVE